MLKIEINEKIDEANTKTFRQKIGANDIFNDEVCNNCPFYQAYGRVIPKDVKRWELLLPCLAFNNKG